MTARFAVVAFFRDPLVALEAAKAPHQPRRTAAPLTIRHHGSSHTHVVLFLRWGAARDAVSWVKIVAAISHAFVVTWLILGFVGLGTGGNGA